MSDDAQVKIEELRRAKEDLAALETEGEKLKDSVAELRTKIDLARSRSYTAGRYERPEEFRRREALLRSKLRAVQENQMMQGEVRRSLRRLRHEVETVGFESAFRKAARRMLTGDQYREIAIAAGEESGCAEVTA